MSIFKRIKYAPKNYLVHMWTPNGLNIRYGFDSKRSNKRLAKGFVKFRYKKGGLSKIGAFLGL